MKRIYNYILLSALTCAAAGCIEDELNLGGQLGNTGDEVQFGLSLNDPGTKTIYGPENDFGFPVYWSEGDKIQIASPQCVEGRNQAEYLVTPESGQSYALAMTRTGDYGVQWGSATADFYSIYPSNGSSWQTLTEENVVAKLNISSEQSANLVLTAAKTEESEDTEGNTVTTIITPGTYQAADMDNVIMYAPKTTANRGEVVKLNYKPYSTILEFELGIAQNQDTEGNELPAWGTVKIVSMTLTAPTGTAIAGDFSLTFNGDNVPTVAAVGNNSNSIKMDFSTQPLLNQENQTLKAKIAMIPLSGVNTLDGWKVTIEVLEGTDEKTKTYSKTFTGSGDKTALAPGKVHKLKLPKFSEIQAWNPPTNAWIPTLEDYKNIYLTELSLPGAWYALGKNENAYQTSDHTAESLWNAGIRAFGVECRTSSTNTGSFFNPNYTPSSVVVSGTGNNGTLGFGDHYSGGTQIRTLIKSIADQVAKSVKRDENGNITDGEYAVLVLSYADGGDAGHRPQDHAFFINGVKAEIANSGATNIYSGTLTSNTTISNVLGQLIIKINVDDNLTKSSYNNDMNALLSYNPFVKQLKPEAGESSVDFTVPRFSKMYWKSWDDSYKTFATFNDTDFLWCFSSANRTLATTAEGAAIPSYEQRKEALKSMILHSRELSESSKHNVWFYFNAGGTEAPNETDDTDAADARTFAENMNAWLLEVIKLKANGGTDINGYLGSAGAYVESDPSSLGIVMFNQCTGDNATYHGADIINEIIEMNNKFKLQRANQTTKSAAPSYSSGMNDSNVAAFGWD